MESVWTASRGKNKNTMQQKFLRSVKTFVILWSESGFDGNFPSSINFTVMLLKNHHRTINLPFSLSKMIPIWPVKPVEKLIRKK